MKQDKKMHLYVGFVICFIAAPVITWLDNDNPNLLLGTVLGFSISFAITLIKEFVWDKALGKGVFSWGDIAYGGVGALLGVVSNLLIYLISCL